MKALCTFLLIIPLILSGCKAKKPLIENIPVMEQTVANQPVTNFSDQSTWLLGYFTREQISQVPHSEWYQKGYDEYQFNTEAVNKLTEISKDNLIIKIVMGTWCPDSRREVPRFMRILDLWKFQMENVTFIGVDNAKLSPAREYEKLDIQRVPTFIFYKNNIEAGRIIEVPVTSLEQDIINILNKE
ncbi:MAG: thioredoxin family protein [Bacteroidales bacterium]|nr:thioredoxin family protein [Bacteroidales bacterium]